MRWRALFLVWHQRHGLVVVVHQDAMLPVFVMVALVGVVERLSGVPALCQVGGLGALRSADFLPRGLVVLA